MFKVPESPHLASRTSPRLNVLNKFSCPVKNTKRDIFRTSVKMCEVRKAENADKKETSPEKVHSRLKTPEKGDAVEMRTLESTLSLGHHPSPKPNTRSQTKSPSPTHQMNTRSGRTPGKSSNIASPCKPVGGSTISEGSDTSKSLSRMRSSQGTPTNRRNLRSRSGENISSEPNTESSDSSGFVERTVQSDKKEEIPAEPSQSSETDSSIHTDSQQFDSSHLNSASTDDDSLDIVDAAVVKTQFTGGLKMKISFSRKPSKSNEDFLLATDSPKLSVPPQGTPIRSYGFRQTPDRQQREAAARLGYGNDSPRFSTPRDLSRLSRHKGTGTSNPLTYQVEMQMSGLPKLKIKRSDSMSAGDLASDGAPRSAAQSPLVGVKPSQLESPLALFSKHRDPGCVSPSVCTHVTPAKSTPRKGGSVQTYICQSYTPTRCSVGTVSPVAIAELIPLTPSPQSVGKVTPDNLNSWPRRKRAQVGMVGGKDRCVKGEPLLEELLEEAELGVSRLQDIEDTDEPSNHKPGILSHAVRADASPLSPLEDMYWMEKLVDCTDPQRPEEEVVWGAEIGDSKSSKL